MELTELRKELIRQHNELRELANLVAVASERARSDAAALPDLLALLDSLYGEVCAHNAYEEAQLHGILPEIDAWGAVRDRLMDQRHAQEHAAILLAVQAATGKQSATTIVDGTALALRDLAAHMDREEKEFLAGDVLRDDLITSGVGG